MPPLHVLRAGAIALLLAVGLAAFAPSFAAHATPPGVDDPGASPGEKYRYGVKVNQLGLVPDFEYDFGGWSRKMITTSGSQVTGNKDKPVAPATITVSEPFYKIGNLTPSTMGMTIALKIKMREDNRTDTVGASYAFASSNTRAYCAATPWSLTSTVVAITSGYSQITIPLKSSGVWQLEQIQQQGAAATPFVREDACPYLQRVDVSSTTYWWAPGADGNDQKLTETQTWTAGDWYEDKSYEDQGTPDDVLCRIPYPDGGYPEFCEKDRNNDNPTMDVRLMCSSPPPTAWLDFTWVPRMVEYYGRCLSMPIGFDRFKKISTAMSHSVNFTIVNDSLPSLLQAAKFSESCGRLFKTAANDTIPGFGVSTCDWTWANGAVVGGLNIHLKDLLSKGILIFGIAGWLYFVVKMVLGLMLNSSLIDIENERRGK